MNNTKTIIRNYWDERSLTFDLSPGHVIANEKEEKAWKSLFQEKIGGGAREILDIGTGTGFLSIMLAEMGYRVVGLDLSEEMIGRARKKARNRGVEVEFKPGDAENLPFGTGSFDAIVNRAVFWTLPDPKKALFEWRRVLKPGGRLCFFLHESRTDGITDRFRRQLGNLVILALERRNPWNQLHNSGKFGVELPFRGGVEPPVITKLLEESGFEEVAAEPMVEIGRLKREGMPMWYKISSGRHLQYCYTAVNPDREKIS